MNKRNLLLTLWPLVLVFLPGVLYALMKYDLNYIRLYPDRKESIIDYGNFLYDLEPMTILSHWIYYPMEILEDSAVTFIILMAALIMSLRCWYTKPSKLNAFYLFVTACLLHGHGMQIYLFVF